MAAPVRRERSSSFRSTRVRRQRRGAPERIRGVRSRRVAGDRVRARVTKTARVRGVTAESVLGVRRARVEPPCPLRRAGGVASRISPTRRRLRRRSSRFATRSYGSEDLRPASPIVPAASLYHYRNKLEYSFTAGENGVDLGFHRAGRWDEVIGIDVPAGRFGPRGTPFAKRGAARAVRPGHGRVLPPTPRLPRGRNTLVVLVTAPGERFETGYFVDVLRRFPEVRSIHWAVNDTPAEQTNVPTKLLWGEDAIEEEILGLRVRLRPNAFLQTNTEMAEQLYAIARELAGLTGVENVFDLYCGTGTIGLSLAADARAVWGLEISEEAVACAIENAELNGVGEREVLRRKRGPDSGAARGRGGPGGRRRGRPAARGSRGKGAPTDGRAGARKLVYVSCNPTTLASDVKVSTRSTATLVRCRPVDMFPHTPHVESVSLLAGEVVTRCTWLPALSWRRRRARRARGGRGSGGGSLKAGSAGSPSVSQKYTRSSVKDKNAVIETSERDAQSELLRGEEERRRRRPAARCSRSRSHLERAMRRDPVEDPGRCSVTYSVGPLRPTRCRPTAPTARPARAVQSASNNDRNQKPNRM